MLMTVEEKVAREFLLYIQKVGTVEEAATPH